MIELSKLLPGLIYQTVKFLNIINKGNDMYVTSARLNYNINDQYNVIPM
jgi:hypothetical protein